MNRPSGQVRLYLQRTLIGAALALMLFHLLVYMVYAVSLVSFPFDYDQGEGFELQDTLMLSRGEWPYRANETYPFYASNYPPLYHVLLIPFAWLFGPEYWYGRLAGFAASLVAAAAIGFAVHRETRHRPVAVLSGLAFLASNYVYHIGPLFRQHMTMVMFETLAVVVIAGFDGIPDTRQRRRQIAIAMLFLLCAGYTKQLSLATAIAVFAFLFLRRPRRAVVWGIGAAAVGGAVFLWINLSTGGQWWINTITANVNQYILGQFTGLLGQFVSLHGALLILAVAVLVYELYFDRLSAYSVWFVASAANSTLAGKWGAGDSYFATLIAAMCILAGIFVGRCLNRNWRFPPAFMVTVERWMARLQLSWLIRTTAQSLTRTVGLIALLLFMLYGLAVIKMPLDGPVFGPIASLLNIQSNTKFTHFYDSAGWTMGYATIGQIPTAADVENGWRIVSAVKADPRPILSEEAAFSFRAGKPVVSNPTQLLNLYNNNHFGPAPLVKMIEEQAFGAVIFRASFYPPPVVDAVKRAYRPQQVIPMNGYEYTILAPDPAWPERRAQ